MPGAVLSAQATVEPPWVVRIVLTAASLDPTLKVPGLVIVKAPALKIQLSAVELFRISISAVVSPKVTALTVTSPLAVKSVVAA